MRGVPLSVSAYLVHTYCVVRCPVPGLPQFGENDTVSYFMYNFTRTAVLNENVCLCAQVSMSNDEIFIIGKPPILLHSKDSGKSWERVPLSPKVSRLLVLVVSTVAVSRFWYVADTGRVSLSAMGYCSLSIAC